MRPARARIDATVVPVMRTIRSLSRATRWTLATALSIGLAERVGWALLRPNGSATGEAFNVAVAIGQGRGFADAFAVGQGPTAHLLPLPPLVAGGVYAALGVQSVAAEAVLLGWSLALTFVTYALFHLVARRVGVPERACTGGFVFLCVAPIFTTVEAFDFRTWEGGMTMSAAGCFLLLLLRAEDGAPLRTPARLALWALPALLLFLQPVIGLAACLAGAIATIRGLRLAPALLAFPLALALLFGGWTVRNMLVLHQPIWLRDNLGLELAVANYPAAVSTADPRGTFQARLEEVHPMVGAQAYRAMQAAGGEAAYARKLGGETMAWMRANPGSTARLWLGHLRQIVLPAPWQFQTAHGVALPIIRAILFDLVSLLGLAGLALLLARWRSKAWLLAPFVLVPILAYVPFQPILRYIWLVYVPLAYLAAQALGRVRLLPHQYRLARG